MVEIRRLPAAGIVTLAALPAGVVRWPDVDVARAAVRLPGMVERGWLPRPERVTGRAVGSEGTSVGIVSLVARDART